MTTAKQPPQDLTAIQEKYAKRIKSRLAESAIDVRAARDGMLDCYVSTYFGGLKAGIQGYLGIDAGEEQVSRIAQALFRKRLREEGVSFENPTIDALDRIKAKVDTELSFDTLPHELRGLHDQVCSLMLSKADGSLGHDGSRSVVRKELDKTRAAEAKLAQQPTIQAAPSPVAPTSSPPQSAAEALRESVARYLEETATAIRTGA
ncbi:MAG: hypothetical protein AAGE52_33515, partial [Myxococcota bacterium]